MNSWMESSFSSCQQEHDELKTDFRENRDHREKHNKKLPLISLN